MTINKLYYYTDNIRDREFIPFYFNDGCTLYYGPLGGKMHVVYIDIENYVRCYEVVS